VSLGKSAIVSALTPLALVGLARAVSMTNNPHAVKIFVQFFDILIS
jgi:hypothetical protein